MLKIHYRMLGACAVEKSAGDDWMGCGWIGVRGQYDATSVWELPDADHYSLPPDLQEWVPPGQELAHHVSENVDALDSVTARSMRSTQVIPRGDGPTQRPTVDDMVKVLIYARPPRVRWRESWRRM